MNGYHIYTIVSLRWLHKLIADFSLNIQTLNTHLLRIKNCFKNSITKQLLQKFRFRTQCLQDIYSSFRRFDIFSSSLAVIEILCRYISIKYVFFRRIILNIKFYPASVRTNECFWISDQVIPEKYNLAFSFIICRITGRPIPRPYIFLAPIVEWYIAKINRIIKN